MPFPCAFNDGFGQPRADPELQFGGGPTFGNMKLNIRDIPCVTRILTLHGTPPSGSQGAGERGAVCPEHVGGSSGVGSFPKRGGGRNFFLRFTNGTIKKIF